MKWPWKRYRCELKAQARPEISDQIKGIIAKAQTADYYRREVQNCHLILCVLAAQTPDGVLKVPEEAIMARRCGFELDVSIDRATRMYCFQERPKPTTDGGIP